MASHSEIFIPVSLVLYAIQLLMLAIVMKWTPRDQESLCVWGHNFTSRICCRVTTILACLPMFGLPFILFIWIKRCDKRHGNSPTGQFRPNNDDGIHSSEYIENITKMSRSVGMILYRGDNRGTAFRVGSKYVMTAWHVVKGLLAVRKGVDEKNLQQKYFKKWTNLDSCEIGVRFRERENLFRLSGNYIFMSAEKDIAVVQIKVEGFGGIKAEELPDPLRLSTYLPMVVPDKVCLIGYGFRRECSQYTELNCKVIQNNSIRIQNAQTHAMSILNDMNRSDINIQNEYSALQDNSFFIIDSCMESGASGSPAIWNDTVVGVYIRGIPNFFYVERPLFEGKLRNDDLFEQCVKTISVSDAIFTETNRELFYELYG